MKARPYRNESGRWVSCPTEEATHIEIRLPGPTGRLWLPVIIKGRREGTGTWTWNADTERPTLKPSLLTKGTEPITDDELAQIQRGEKPQAKEFRCHSFITDGQAIFLDDSSHLLKGSTVDLLDL